MTYSIGRYLNVDWVRVDPTYDVKLGTYFFIKSFKDVDEATLSHEMFNLGIASVSEYERACAMTLWDAIEGRGDKPIYVSVSAYPVTYEPVTIYRLEVVIQAQKLSSGTPVVAVVYALKDLLIALGFFILAVALATIVFTAVFTGKPPEVLPKEFLWAVIALASAGTVYYVYRIIRK